MYIYWLPVNWFEYEMFKSHSEEVNEFKAAVSEFIDFVPISYIDFWNEYGNKAIFQEIISSVRLRYEINLK